jgi:hypothetical protein
VEFDKWTCNVIMRPCSVIMGQWNLNRGPRNVIMGLWHVNRGPWNVNR